MIERNQITGIIVLAAGGSKRMSEPKQLLRWRGKSLLRRAAESAVRSVFQPVVVVLGANYEAARTEIEDLPVATVFNENWQTGLSSSIKIGLERLLVEEPNVSGALIALADQPFVTERHLDLFAEKFRTTENLIVAARYDETIGVPALFAREIFTDLASLSGDKGAKVLFEKHRDQTEIVALPEAAFDVDTPEDFTRLRETLV